MLSTWSTISCTARLTRFTLVARPIRTLVITSRVTATPWEYTRLAASSLPAPSRPGLLDRLARSISSADTPARAETLRQLVEPLLRLLLLGEAEQQAQEDLPLAPFDLAWIRSAPISNARSMARIWLNEA